MNEAHIFADRVEAGRALAERLIEKNYEKPVVLALPRGGVPVAAEVAKALGAPLDIVLVRKIGVPYQPELVINEDVRRLAHVSDKEIERAKARELAEIERRRALYLQGRARVPIEGATAIVIDDGIATGATVRAALKALRRGKPKKLVLAVAVAPPDTIERLRGEVDEIVCLETPEPFYAIGFYYSDFGQVSDQEVIALLARTAEPTSKVAGPAL